VDVRKQLNIRRQWRRVTMAGLAVAVGGGALLTFVQAPPVVTAQDSQTIEQAAPTCRTILQGDRTSLQLYDLSQFVPVTGLPASSVAADTPQPAGTPVMEDELLATPEAQPDISTPIAAPTGATPVASPIAEAAFAAVSDEDQLRSVVFGVLNCTNLRDFDTLGDLVTNTYLRFAFAGGADLPRRDLLLLAEVTVIPEMELIAFDNVEVSGDSATAEVLTLIGNQLRHDEWAFVRADATSPWKALRTTPLAPYTVAGAATVDVTIDTTTISTDPRDVSGGNVVLAGSNSDIVDHEMLVLRLPSGTTTEILLQYAGPALPPGVEFIGQMTVPAEGDAVLPLMNLPAGNYVIVDMLLDDNGVPNLASGFRARLVIAAPGA
jgi:hypothetical protein